MFVCDFRYALPSGYRAGSIGTRRGLASSAGYSRQVDQCSPGVPLQGAAGYRVNLGAGLLVEERNGQFDLQVAQRSDAAVLGQTELPAQLDVEFQGHEKASFERVDRFGCLGPGRGAPASGRTHGG